MCFLLIPDRASFGRPGLVRLVGWAGDWVDGSVGGSVARLVGWLWLVAKGRYLSPQFRVGWVGLGSCRVGLG